jgi:hypothetical protein
MSNLFSVVDGKSRCVNKDVLLSISSTFYEQLFLKKIPKAQKDSQVISVILRFYDLVGKS